MASVCQSFVIESRKFFLDQPTWLRQSGCWARWSRPRLSREPIHHFGNDDDGPHFSTSPARDFFVAIHGEAGMRAPARKEHSALQEPQAGGRTLGGYLSKFIALGGRLGKPQAAFGVCGVGTPGAPGPSFEHRSHAERPQRETPVPPMKEGPGPSGETPSTRKTPGRAIDRNIPGEPFIERTHTAAINDPINHGNKRIIQLRFS